jgi:signal transduction histidine kinase
VSPWVLRAALCSLTLLAVLALPFGASPADGGYMGTYEGTPPARSFLALTGAPAVVYLALWWALPSDLAQERERSLAAASSAVRGRPGTAGGGVPSAPSRAFVRWSALALIAALAAMVLVVCVPMTFYEGLMGSSPLRSLDVLYDHPLRVIVLGVGIPVLGLVLGLLPLQYLDRERWSGRVAGIPKQALASLVLALGAITLGTLAAVAVLFGWTTLWWVLAAVAAAGVLAALLIVPWGRHLWGAIREETAQRALVQQRSEFTAHLHDSVLQTLTVLQRAGTDPEDVRRLARRQERELRRWLYQQEEASAGPEEQVREAVVHLAEACEDDTGVDVHTVVVGDRALDDQVRPLLAALREATSNACRHGRVDVDVFVDIEPERIEAFVRDRGEGFDLSELAQVPEDRLGVRESIIGRMRRAGGSATVRRAPGGGTEVALHLGLRSEG